MWMREIILAKSSLSSTWQLKHAFDATILARMLSGLSMVAYACACKGRKRVVFVAEAAKGIYDTNRRRISYEYN